MAKNKLLYLSDIIMTLVHVDRIPSTAKQFPEDNSLEELHFATIHLHTSSLTALIPLKNLLHNTYTNYIFRTLQGFYNSCTRRRKTNRLRNWNTRNENNAESAKKMTLVNLRRSTQHPRTTKSGKKSRRSTQHSRIKVDQMRLNNDDSGD